MTLITTVVYNDEAALKHLPASAGDKIAGSLVQLSADATQTMTIGSDGGLLVTAVAVLPDDQVLFGDPSGSVILELTPDVQPNGDTNYSIKGDIKLSPAEDNAATLNPGGLYVAKTVFTAGSSPTTTDDGSTPTTFFGGNTSALGTPEGFFTVEIGGQQKLVPFYAMP